ncbi:GTPase Der [Paenibacillus solanacearum]|uniref:GTPase Der n=1 Tax=Paenibacillus solanacearum TaxID=2048548 RepID=A0A916JXA2_9BACL|nr:dynamin family protein [Paenibacillus solanacearum]CAG7611279.1 GTPase Der [Paenibacillus solanacearum]
MALGEQSVEAVQSLLTRVEQAGDAENGRKLRQLLAKAESGRLSIAFCGHFSAGKSSLINRLCGHPLLPSSPIPTSANIVSIVSGEAGAQVVHRLGVGQQAEAKVEQVPLEELAEHCRNGESIETVEIRYPIPFLGNTAALLDTPGIDSTDDAHQLATESALHLADVVFYVMDYNHVQSEINLSFTKKMTEWGKPLYLIVNMVDKHREQELPFDKYKAGVREAFANWHVHPDGILYTSVRVPDHPASEWSKLDWLLGRLIELREPLVRLSLEKSARALAAAHAAKMAEANEPAKEALRAKLAADEGAEAAQEAYAQASAELARLHALPQQLDKAVRQSVASVLDNANIIPAVTRDLAHVYLESRRPGFKVGWFGSSAKTAAEVEQRLAAFHKDFASQVETQVARHVQQAMKAGLEGQGLPQAAVTEAADRIHADISPEWLAKQVNEAAVFGNEYTLNYSKQIAAEAKSLYRKEAFATLDAMLASLGAALAPRREALQCELAALEARLGSLRELERLAQAEAAYAAALQAQLPASSAPALPAPEAAPAAAAAEELAGVAALQTIRRSLREKAERLEHNRFTVALFGAFSAGKSSFANALIGERILPVSPNPTTAAINKIMPPEPEAGWPHGTAKVQMKSRERLESDVLYSLEVLGVAAGTLEQAVKAIAQLKAEHVPGKGKPHYAFLKAVEKGWDAMSPSLGQQLKVSAEEFGLYAADESRSCFVELIELYYANPLTDQGVVLVDTPGADSINARHTGVAFDYIKNADAILFVTYYNHAFSHADKQFLLQLGRVKDSFELDKMFFIVNAADLASSEEELAGVVGHLESNLLQHGIRNPRIYPLSSYYALEGKMNQDRDTVAQSGILPFERQFVRFTFEELSEMAIAAGLADIRRAAGVLRHWMDGAQADADERGRQARELTEKLSVAKAELAGFEPEADLRELSKEIQELLYYVKQRTAYRFGDLFLLAFNPSVFREDTRDSKTVLMSAWEDLRRMISFDLTQEVLATTLRVENKVNKLAERAARQLADTIRERIPSFENEGFEPFKMKTPALEGSLPAEDIGAKWLSGFFKNTKQFFEGDGKQRLRTELEAKLNVPMTQFAEAQAAALEAAYAGQLRDAYRMLTERMTLELEEHAAGLIDALEMKIDLNELGQKQERLLRYIDPSEAKGESEAPKGVGE